MPVDWTQILLALIAGVPAMITAIVTLIITLRGNSSLQQTVKSANKDCAKEVKETVREEANKTALVAKDVKETLIESNHKKDLIAQETSFKLDTIIDTSNTTKTLVNGNMTSILQTSADALLKVADIAAKMPSTDLSKPVVQEVRLTADSEVKITDETRPVSPKP